MIENQNHIIHKQVLDINIQQETNASEIQNTISKLCDEKLPNLLDSVFSRLELKNSHLLIPMLEIDLKDIPYENFSDEFLNQLEKNLYNQIRLKLEKLKITKDYYRDYSIPDQEYIFNSDQQILFVFIEFLKTGVSDQPRLFSNITELELRITEIFQNNKFEAIHFRLLWCKSFNNNPNSINRLISQFSEPFLKEFAEFIWKLPIDKWDTLWDEYKKSLLASIDISTSAQQKTDFYSAVFRILSGYTKAANFLELINACRIYWKNIAPKLNKTSNTKPSNSTSKDNAIANELGSIENIHEDQNRRKVIEKEDFDQSLTRYFDPEIENTEKFAEKIYINNAGLIIVAPFFQRLFEQLEYTSENEFISSELQERAIHLTQYIVTGEERSSENFLTLNKLLCGWPINETIIRDIELSDSEKEECTSLLNSIINNWAKLGNSSISALRETFLLRNGILQKQNGNNSWVLQVERKDGIDILMDHLPWTISIIKLPWMTDKLYTNWV